MRKPTQHLHQSPNKFPEIDHTRLEIDRALENRAAIWINNAVDFEMVQSGEMAPSEFVEYVASRSPEELSSAVRVMLAVILGAFVMQGCSAGQMHPITGDEPISVEANQPEKNAPEKKPEELEQKVVQEKKDLGKTDEEKKKEKEALELADEELKNKMERIGLWYESNSYDSDHPMSNPEASFKILEELKEKAPELYDQYYDYLLRNISLGYYFWKYLSEHPDDQFVKEFFFKFTETRESFLHYIGLWYKWNKRLLDLPYYKEWAELAFIRKAKERPNLFLELAFDDPEIENEQYFKDLVEEAMITVKDEDPVSFINLDEKSIGARHPNFIKFREEAAKKIATEDPFFYFSSYHQKKDIPESLRQAPCYDEVFKIAAINLHPIKQINYIDWYIDRAWAEEVLESALNNFNSSSMFHIVYRQLSRHKEVPLIKKIAIRFSLKFPEGFLDYFKGAKEILGEEADEIKRAYDLLPEAVGESDFPLTPKTFDLTLRAINEKAKRDTEYKENKGRPLVSIPIDEFRRVFYSNFFQDFISKQLGELTYMNVFSLAQDVYYRISEGGHDMNDDTIGQVVSEIYAEWKYVSERELLGPNTKLILFTHEEEQFDNELILNNLYFRSGGKKENVLASINGQKIDDDINLNKELVLDAIRNSEGSTTILFSGHGSKANWAFSNNQADNLNNYLYTDPRTINYEELGKALIQSGNIENVNLMGCSCYSYDYLENLFTYLKERGEIRRPFIAISETSKDRLGQGASGYGTALLESIFDVSEKGEAIKVKHFFKAEGLVWQEEDPSIFINPSIFNVPPKCSCDGESWSKRDERRLKKILPAHIYEGYQEHPLPFEAAIKEIIDHYDLDDDDIMPFYTGRKISNDPFEAIGFLIPPFRFFIAPIVIKKLSGGTLLSHFVNRCPEMLKEVEPSIIFKTPGIFYDFESINKRMRNAYWPWTEEVVTEAARRDPDNFIYYYDRIKVVLTKDKAEELLEECKEMTTKKAD